MGYQWVNWAQRKGDLLQVLDDYVIAVSISQIIAGLKRYGLDYSPTQVLSGLQILKDEGKVMRIVVRGRHFWKSVKIGGLW